MINSLLVRISLNLFAPAVIGNEFPTSRLKRFHTRITHTGIPEYVSYVWLIYIILFEKSAIRGDTTFARIAVYTILILITIKSERK